MWFLQMLQNWIWISPWHKKPWHQKGGSQLDSKLSGGPWALKMESGTECTVCAILKMSSDNSSFETGVGILWLMCTWAFQVLYSRAWQTSVATWPGVRDIWMKIALRFTLMCSTWAWSVPSNAWSYLKMINWDNLFRILYILYSDLPWSDPPNAWSNLKINDYEITIYWSGVEPSTA